MYRDDLTGLTAVENLEIPDVDLTKQEESGLYRLKEANCTLLTKKVIFMAHYFDAHHIDPVKPYRDQSFTECY